MMENKNFISDVQYYFIEVEEIQKNCLIYHMK